MTPATLLTALTTNALLVGQVLFSTTFVGSCELANVLSGNYSVGLCLDRWYVVTALFFPSATQQMKGADTRRRFFGGGSDAPRT